MKQSVMNQYYKAIGWIGLIGILVLCSISCKERRGKKIEEQFSINSLKSEGGPYQLCEQKLTSEEAILAVDISEDDEYCFDREAIPIKETFFFPEEDIEDSELVRRVQLRYNYANVLYRVLHSYELFCRKSSGDSLATRRDSLELIAYDLPVISSLLLKDAIIDTKAGSAAEKLLSAYAHFDGNSEIESEFDNAYHNYIDGNESLPKIVNDSLLTDFEEHFWEWYDKRKYVPEYDQIAALYLNDEALKNELTKDEIEHFKAVIEGEKDIDRRTILSLELIRCSRDAFRDATMYLGEILESGIYTKYILEAWLAWRAAVQLEFFAPSSYSLIPNNYYDKIRVKCMNTILRHIQINPDKYDACLLDNFIYCEILHRMGSAYGNEALTDISELVHGMFIQPSALGKDYLKEEQ